MKNFKLTYLQIPVLAFLVGFAANSYSQNELYNDGADIYVQAGGLIYVQGEIINDDQGANLGRMHNVGDIQLTGNWQNTSTTTNVFDPFAAGTVTFLGTGAVQTIGPGPGAQLDTYFNNLTVNKSGGATQEVRQLRNTLADGVTSLTNDFINTQTFTYLVANPNPLALTRTGVAPYTNSMTLGYVTSTPGSAGRLARATSNAFPGAVYFFPLGNGTRFRPIEVTPTSVGNNVYRAQFVNVPTFSTGLHSPSLASIFPTWYHFIERTIPAGSPENIRIYWDDISDTYCTFPSTTLSEWNSALWEDLSPTTTVGNVAPILSHTTKNTYPGAYSTPWSTNSFALADLFYGPVWGPPCVLPVTSTPLMAHARTSDIVLTWTTESETHNDGFEMQRSTDNQTFEVIGWVDGAGNSTTTVPYSLVDSRVVVNQRYYYRFRQIDDNGASTYSNIAEAIITGNGAFVMGEFFPNPGTGANQLWVIAPEKTDISVKIVNPLGQEVFGDNIELSAGYNEIPFNLSLLADGNYYAVIMHGSDQYVRKFSLER